MLLDDKCLYLEESKIWSKYKINIPKKKGSVFILIVKIIQKEIKKTIPLSIV